jgi:hypothetical protein
VSSAGAIAQAASEYSLEPRRRAGEAGFPSEKKGRKTIHGFRLFVVCR